jgi:hypothetical protein
VASKQTAPWDWDFFQRHVDDDSERAVPARIFLESCPDKVQAKLMAVVSAVADAPPPAFSGGGKWEAMHDDMAGIYEVRVDFNAFHHRLFCVLDRSEKGKGLAANTLIVIDGERKPYRTTISAGRYREIRKLADEYLARRPRSLCEDFDDEEEGRNGD